MPRQMMLSCRYCCCRTSAAPAAPPANKPPLTGRRHAQALRRNYRALSVLLHEHQQQLAQSSTQLAAERDARAQLDATVQAAQQAAQQAERQQQLQQAQAAALQQELDVLRTARQADTAQAELMSRCAVVCETAGRHGRAGTQGHAL